MFVHDSRVTQQNRPQLTVSKSDFSNAFNSQSRTAVLTSMQKYDPESMAYIESLLRPTSRLAYGGMKEGIMYVSNKEGSQQGGRSSTKLFCASVMEPLLNLDAVSRINSVVGGGAKGYCDDFEVVSTNSGILKGVSALLQGEGEGTLPKLNMKKHSIKLGESFDKVELDKDIKASLDAGIPLCQILIHPNKTRSCY
jgi:hypothetical protein